MSVRNLEYLFRPTAVAVVGASERLPSVGGTVVRNLLAGGFAGPIMPVNPKYRAVAGVLAYPDVDSLPIVPDLAVICTPPATVPGLIAALGERGVKAAIVLTAGLERGKTPDGQSLADAMLAAARPRLLRILGPNCVGLTSTAARLNASFAHTHPLPGSLAFLTQSGALSTAMLDWAKSQRIGLSHFVSVGNSADVDFGDLLDYLASDVQTRSILMYIESIRDARKFLSAARAAARNKPVIAVKAGRVGEAARAAASHTGALAGADDVYDAAIRRAGMLRVDSIEGLFDAVETLARARPLEGEGLTILTNGGGPGVMAVDALAAGGGTLAELAPETLRRLDALLPANWSRGNPVDIVGDAQASRYVDALRVLLDDPQTAAVLVVHAPTALAPSEEIARAVAPVVRAAGRTALTCWLGKDAVESSRRVFAEAGVPSYDSPEDAVRAFVHMVQYRRNQLSLGETPLSESPEAAPDLPAARRAIDAALRESRAWLTEAEAKDLLQAYGVPIAKTRVAATPREAGDAADALGYPIAVKILSPDITHKSDVGGVALNLRTRQEVEDAATQMEHRVAQTDPYARLAGFTVQQMVRRPRAVELIVGCACDPVFGPVILFGEGGTAVEVIRDRAVALPPLNMSLAARMVEQTRVARRLAGYRDRPPADRHAILETLVKISQLVADLPEVVELDVNPLLADEAGVTALDARVRVAPAESPGAERLAIRAYPRQLEEEIDFDGRRVRLRPIRPEDLPAHKAFFDQLAPEDVQFRFYGRQWPENRDDLGRFVQIDYNREMAFIASARRADGTAETLGVVRGVSDPDNVQVQMAIIVRSDVKGRGLGYALLEKLLRYFRDRGAREMVGLTSRGNRAMLELGRSLGFQCEESDQAADVTLRRRL